MDKEPYQTGKHQVFLKGIVVAHLSENDIARYFPFEPADGIAWHYVIPKQLEINAGIFCTSRGVMDFPDVTIVQKPEGLHLSCSCDAEINKLCRHQAIVLNAIVRKQDYLIFFDDQIRHEKLKVFASDYGMENELDLDQYFTIRYENKRLEISSRWPELLPITNDSLSILKGVIVKTALPVSDNETRMCIVLKQHKYYRYLVVELYQAQTTLDGKIKNPLISIAPLDSIWDTEDADQLRFFTAIHKFQSHVNQAISETDITALKAIVKNPLNLPFYLHDSEVSENVTAASVMPAAINLMTSDLKLSVEPKDQFFELSGTAHLGDRVYALKELNVKFGYFLLADQQLYLVKNLQVLNVMELWHKKQGNLLVHASKFDTLRNQLLAKLEEKISIDYKHIPKATPDQLEKEGFNTNIEQIIYLSDFGAHVMIIPVMRYGEVEISIRTKKQIYTTDQKGKPFLVNRNYDLEDNFTALLIRQHPNFAEQLEDDLHYFYLHKRYFLDENWFPDVFETWQEQGITILGFNELEGNKINLNKVKISIKVLSGINWFNTVIDVRFGKKKAALKQIYRAVKNKTKYIELDDGTLGILPEEWLLKFAGYFNAGEVANDELHISRSNFTVIEQLFDEAMVDQKVRDELNNYRQKLANFEKVQDVVIPIGFKGKLRPYQQQGLNWLNFLDDFGFGGCLADDMGLGKTIQIIAFILSQQQKANHNTNLIIVPTSLIHNWQHEIHKFAPNLKVKTIYGATRVKSIDEFDNYQVILTSYGTLLADIVFLKNYRFNYVFLDESQQIKNPESQRYKAVCLLKSKGRILLTGTPVENNTFDIYGQLSFACPGLLGSKSYFKRLYSSPIDLFKSYKRSEELQNRIKPFILRRTKQQVASELPDKTEMVLYCDMSEKQREIYNTYETELRDLISATDGDDIKKSSMHVLKGLTRLRQICDSPLLIKGEKMPGNASAKIEMLLQEIEQKKHQHKILVFSQFVGMLDLIKIELIAKNIRFSYLTGQTRNRQGVVEEFQNDPEVRVFLISLKAGGTGLNLTEADYVYLVDPWWNPAVENQAIDRCHRIGQDKNIVAVRLICPDTVEDKIMILQETKKDLADSLIKTDNTFFSNLNKNDLLRLLS